ncbi:hypothetical protein V491_08868 [Pseudogymnoascus sp. VKM F-3775]|nr:hypothetical protein V491_08868 [Pseudogymnoascus sp. VKM F-3775]
MNSKDWTQAANTGQKLEDRARLAQDIDLLVYQIGGMEIKARAFNEMKLIMPAVGCLKQATPLIAEQWGIDDPWRIELMILQQSWLRENGEIKEADELKAEIKRRKAKSTLQQTSTPTVSPWTHAKIPPKVPPLSLPFTVASHQAVLLEGVAEANAWPIMGYYSGPHANYSTNAFLYPLVTMKSRLDREESQKATFAFTETMAISTDFIVGLIFNLLSIIASLITMWQTQKILALKQSPHYASLNDIEASIVGEKLYDLYSGSVVEIHRSLRTNAALLRPKLGPDGHNQQKHDALPT